MKPWKVRGPKTRLDAKRKNAGASHTQKQVRRRALTLVILVLWLIPVACSQDFIRPAQLQSTSEALAAVPGTQVAPAMHTAEIPTVDPATATAMAVILPSPVPTQKVIIPTPAPSQEPPILYYTQAGDTLKALAVRFNVKPEEITSPQPIPAEGLFDPNILLIIPPRLGEVSSNKHIIPDSEVVYSPSALDLDVGSFIKDAGGYLSTTYKEWRSTGWHDGKKTILRVSSENSINPRLLLSILEKQSHWVYGQPENLAQTDYPIGWLKSENEQKSLYYQLDWAVQQLNIGYYGWRDGDERVMTLTFPDGATLRLAPDLNAGSVAVMYMFSRLYNQAEWAGALYGTDGLMSIYEKMFGNPWLRAQSVEPLFPATLTQPPFELPFQAGHTWSFTGGPHSAWGKDGARAALDFAPSSVDHGCVKSDEWATAVSSGLVVRSDNGVVVLDLDGDGYEQTGWSILYLHVATEGRVLLGTWVNLGDSIGHPSCEGGVATGTHIHIARKYNGEWILADGPMPFNLSGWRAHAGQDLYIGTLTKEDQTVYSSLVGSHESLVTRPKTSN